MLDGTAPSGRAGSDRGPDVGPAWFRCRSPLAGIASDAGHVRVALEVGSEGDRHDLGGEFRLEWLAGDDGAEWIEIHSGVGGIFTDGGAP